MFIKIFKLIFLFLFVSVLYVASLFVYNKLNEIDNINLQSSSTLLLSVSFTLLILLIIVISNCKTLQEKFTFELDPSKKCDGGMYLYQGGSEWAKTCRQYLNSNEGQEMTKNNCTRGLYKFRTNKNLHLQYTSSLEDEEINKKS